jgi:hypothetical protein
MLISLFSCKLGKCRLALWSFELWFPALDRLKHHHWFVRKIMVHPGFCIEIHWILNHCQQKFSNRTFSMMLATDDISGARAEPLYDKPCRCLQPGDPVEEIKGSKPKIWTWMYAPLSHNVTVAVFHIVWNSSCFMVLHIFGISRIGVIIHPYDTLFRHVSAQCKSLNLFSRTSTSFYSKSQLFAHCSASSGSRLKS